MIIIDIFGCSIQYQWDYLLFHVFWQPFIDSYLLNKITMIKFRLNINILKESLLYWRVILISLMVFHIQASFSITPFDTIYSKPEDERLCDVIEFPNFYILSGDAVDSGFYCSYVIKIDKSGKIIKDTVFNHGSLSHKVFKLANDIALIRINFIDSTQVGYITFTKMDTSLNVIFEKQLSLPDSLYVSNYNGVISSDGKIIIAGTTNQFPGIPFNFDPFLYSISFSGDSLSTLFIKNPGNIDACDGICIKDNKFFMFVNYFGGVSGVMIVVDSTFAILDTLKIQNNLHHKYSPKLIQDSIFVICASNLDEEILSISKIDETGHIVKSENFGKNNSATFPAYQNSLAIKDNNILFLVTADFCRISPFFGYGKPSSLLVGKLDYDLNAKWLQYYGGDKYYHAFNIKATSDGGCICIGTVNDTINHNNKRDIFVLKLDSNGLVSWDQTIEIPKVNINVFPNPSNDKVNINISDFDFQDAIIEIYNVKGTKIHSIEHMSSNLEIDVVGWSPGIYLGRIIIEGKRFTTFKFVVY